jgi:hypothetical protein
MTRIDWTGTGQRFFEAGIDRGVLYVGDGPGVPWIGLVNVSEKQSGGQAKPRFLDGVKISNRASPEDFEATIEAFTHPLEFEQCDGTAMLENGLRVTRQRRKPFSMIYRTKVGNDSDGLDHAYKIHILYNLKAEPSDRGRRTLSDQNEPMTFSWNVTSRATLVAGMRPSAHYVVDSRDVPAELLQELEDILYGTSSTEPSLPTPGELVFLFDSFQDLVYDAGGPYTPVFETYDAFTPEDTFDETIDGGAL